MRVRKTGKGEEMDRKRERKKIYGERERGEKERESE